MTKSTGVGRGGKRDGAGRKKRAKAPRPVPRLPSRSQLLAMTAEEIKRAVRESASAIVASLLQVALDGEKDADRVKAAKELLDRGFGRPAPEASKGASPPLHDERDPSGDWDSLLQ